MQLIHFENLKDLHTIIIWIGEFCVHKLSFLMPDHIVIHYHTDGTWSGYTVHVQTDTLSMLPINVVAVSRTT